MPKKLKKQKAILGRLIRSESFHIQAVAHPDGIVK